MVVIARGQGFTADRVMKLGMRGKDLVEALRNVVKPDTVICSDSISAYFALPRELGVTLKMFSLHTTREKSKWGRAALT